MGPGESQGGCGLFRVVRLVPQVAVSRDLACVRPQGFCDTLAGSWRGLWDDPPAV